MDLGHEVGPFGKATTDLALRKLQQQGADRRMEPLQVGELDQPVAISDQLGLQAVQVSIGGVLMQLEVAGRVKRDRSSAAGSQ